jgi:hypothetical protein
MKKEKKLLKAFHNTIIFLFAVLLWSAAGWDFFFGGDKFCDYWIIAWIRSGVLWIIKNSVDYFFEF